MKRWVALCLAGVLTVSLCACDGGAEESSLPMTTTATTTEKVAPTTTTTTTTTEESTTTTTAESVTAVTTTKKPTTTTTTSTAVPTQTTTTQKTVATTVKQADFELQFLRIERAHPSIQVDGKDIWERLAGSKHILLLQEGDKIIYRFINRKDPKLYSLRASGTNCTVTIDGDIVTVTATPEHAIYVGFVPFITLSFGVYERNWKRVADPVGALKQRIYCVPQKEPVPNVYTVANMLVHYAYCRMDYMYTEPDGPFAEKKIPFTKGTEWIETAIETLDNYIVEDYRYFKISVLREENAILIRVANELLS